MNKNNYLCEMGKNRFSILALTMLLVLFTGTATAAVSDRDAARKSACTIQQHKPELPFFHDGKALLSASALVSSSEHFFKERSSFFTASDFTAFVIGRLPAILPPLTGYYFALFFNSIILFPFHSFW